MKPETNLDKPGKRSFVGGKKRNPTRPMTAKNMFSNRCRGFSLIELMVVVVIIGLVMAFAVPAASTLVRGSSVKRGADMLTDEISRARQHALSKNKTVEVRFFNFIDPEISNDTAQFRAFQCFEVSGQVVAGLPVRTPISKYVQMPDTVMMSSDATLSSLFGNTSASTQTPWPTPWTIPTVVDPELPRGVKKNYQYVAFQFLPDGTTNLRITTAGSATNTVATDIPSCVIPTSPNPAWFISIQLVKDAGKVPGGTPPLTNFATWMIDPVWGTTKTVRPGQ